MLPPAVVDALTRNSPYPFIQAKHFTSASRTVIDLITIHTAETPMLSGIAHRVAEWFASPEAPRASAHFCVDPGAIIQCVDLKDVAWHAPGMNRRGIGIEHAGRASYRDSDWDTPMVNAMLLRSAWLTARLSLRYKIPIVRLSPEDLIAGKRGICGHVDATEAGKLPGGVGFAANTHWDPGPHFPWPLYERMANGFRVWLQSGKGEL